MDFTGAGISFCNAGFGTAAIGATLELIALTRQAMEDADNHLKLPALFYSLAFGMFFAYCYPIARLTMALGRRFAVKP